MPSPVTRRTLLTLAGASAASAIAMPAWAADDMRPAAARPPRLSPWDRQIVSRIDARETLANLTHLAERIGQRYSGTPAENTAAEFLGRTLRGYGYEVQLQPFSVPERRIAELSGSLDPALCWGVGVAARGQLRDRISGPLVLAPSPVPAQLPDTVRGAIVLREVESATEDLTALAEAAAAKGALAFIATRVDAVYPRQASAFAPALTRDVGIPVVGVGQVQKHALLDAAPSTLTIRMWNYANPTSYNVIATRRANQGGPAREAQNVMVCAHYDSVIGARGANDDGSGTVLTLELARLMRRLPVRTNLQFVLWGSEEIGLVGSRHYVAQLDEAARGQVRGVFNNDMVGTSWDPAERYWVLSYDGLPNVVNQQVLAAGERLGYRARMSDVTARGSSDHQSFQEAGMPSGNFSWRGVESPALLEPEYHSADDTIAENISMERLTVSMELIGCAAYALARA